MYNDNLPTKQRLLITFGKTGPLKYTSNLDLAKTWERLLRRVHLPLLYSQGFNTRPRIQLASALPLGISSECEMIDIALKEVIPLAGVKEQLQESSPQGLEIYRVDEIDLRHPTLQSLVRSAEYEIRFDETLNPAILKEKVETLLARQTIIKVVERKNRKSSFDFRSLIYDLAVSEEGHLIAHVAVGDYGNVRPEDLVSELDLEDYYRSTHRRRLHLIE
jgi:radical SAM-linked protein